LAAANVTASIHTGSDGAEQLVFTSPNQAFQVTAGDTTANALLGNLSLTAGGAVANTGGVATADTFGAAVTGAGAIASFVAGGTQETASTAYTTTVATDAQTLAFTVNGAAGAAQTASVTLNGPNTAAQAVATINADLQATDNPALQGIVASVDAAGANITFSSNSAGTFNVSIGSDVLGGAAGTADALGFANPNTTLTSAVVGTGATSSIVTEAGAQVAVSALANSVSTLGSAQAAVGRGENQFTYAINLAQSELTNEAAAESGIRDANLAQEAANLTKAQILLQAGVAALSQANAAPQNILALLKT
jgi:flagellin